MFVGLISRRNMELFKNINADYKTLNSLALAFIGDTIFDLLTRGMIVAEGNAPVNKMHKKAKSIVNATSQSKMYSAIEDKLSEEELAVLKREMLKVILQLKISQLLIIVELLVLRHFLDIYISKVSTRE